MVLIDANAILRIILNDNENMTNTVKELIINNQVLVKNEVMAEIIYVLLKVYRVNRRDIAQCLLDLMEIKNIATESKTIITLALETFKEKNLDFVDCLLYAHHFINGEKVFTFDKALIKIMS